MGELRWEIDRGVSQDVCVLQKSAVKNAQACNLFSLGSVRTSQGILQTQVNCLWC